MDDLDRFVDSRGRIDKKMLHLRGLLSDMNLLGEDIRAEGLGGSALREAKGFRAEGDIAEAAYTVGVFWGGELGEQTTIRGWPHDRDLVLGVMGARVGEPVPIPGLGETVPLNLNHPLAILGALVAWGEVRSFGGDLPPGWLDVIPAGGS